MAYATPEEVAERWRPLSESEQGKAAVLLDDAAVFLDAELERCGLTPDGRTDQLRYVSCQMVIRALQSSDFGDVASVSHTAGSFTEQVSFNSSSGFGLYLKSDERRLLGISLRRGLAAHVYPWGG